MRDFFAKAELFVRRMLLYFSLHVLDVKGCVRLVHFVFFIVHFLPVTILSK